MSEDVMDITMIGIIEGEKMQPLYRFKLDEETGEITRLEITDYALSHWNNGEQYYRWQIMSNVHYCYLKKDMDRYKCKRLYTFNPDFEHAREIIKQFISEKRCAAHEEYLRNTELIEKIERAVYES